MCSTSHSRLEIRLAWMRAHLLEGGSQWLLTVKVLRIKRTCQFLRLKGSVCYKSWLPKAIQESTRGKIRLVEPSQDWTLILSHNKEGIKLIKTVRQSLRLQDLVHRSYSIKETQAVRYRNLSFWCNWRQTHQRKLEVRRGSESYHCKIKDLRKSLMIMDLG